MTTEGHHLLVAANTWQFLKTLGIAGTTAAPR